MRPVLGWIDKILSEQNSDHGCCIYAMVFKPDGSELLVAAEQKIIIYDPFDGTVLQTLKGHKDLVYALAWSTDGETFASGSADKSVILWTHQHEGTLKYSHSEAIQCLAFSPTSSSLLSCAMYDFALWSQTEKNVQKQRMPSRCCSCAWNKDGTMFAIGTIDGFVHLRRTTGFNDEPFAKIERPGGDPVWAVRFTLPRVVDDGLKTTNEESPGEMLAVTDWGQKLTYYDMDGNSLSHHDKSLDFEPSCMEYFNNDKFLLLGGSKDVYLYTRLGLNLGKVCQMDTWVWCVAARPNSNHVYVACVDGSVACYQLTFGTVHGLHKDRYAFRDNMTEVIVQHMAFQTMTRLKCNDCVRKVAIYNGKLAVQLSDKVHIYTQITGEKEDERLEFRLTERINKTFDCSLLVVCSKHVIFCTEHRLQCYDHKGIKQREWTLASMIRYIKPIGGPPGKETILVGLKDGQVCKIFVDNPFPVLLLKISCAIKCLDMSLTWKHLAVVDESGVCTVYDTTTMDSLFQETNCNSVSFNADNENIVCYSSDTQLTIRANSYPGFTQRMIGFVVGFAGNKVFCLHAYTMTGVEVPFSNQLYQYIENKQYELAYRLANLGVTEEDWGILGNDALASMELEIASRAFARCRDHRSQQLIRELREMQAVNEPEVLIKAHILAYQKRFREVASLYRQHGYENKAMELFTELRMFEDAQDVMAMASGETQKMLMRKRADWARDSNQPKVAAEMLISSGDLDKALQLVIENDWMDLAINVMRKLDRGDVDTLRTLAGYFVRKAEYSLASKIYASLNDTKSMVQMHVTAGHWTDAFAIADRYPKYVEDVYLPYARHLAESDRFEEAQRAFHKAGREQEALRVLEQLTHNAVVENRFADAGYYHWLLSEQYLERSNDNPSLIPKYQHSRRLAEVYYAYHAVYLYCNQPFTSDTSETLLNMSRFISFHETAPSVSLVLTYFAMAKLGHELGAYKLAREALEKLSKLRVPNKFQRTIGILSLTIRARPYADAEELLPPCYRCGMSNPLIGGLSCIHCKTPFVYSFATFEVLPLVEFFVDDSIEGEEAVRLIDAEPPLNGQSYSPFQGNQKKGGRVVLNRDNLSRLEKGRVVVLSLPPPLSPRYFYNLIPSVAVSACPACHKVFHMDDFEMSLLQKGACPFCRSQHHRIDPSVYMDDDDE